MEESNKLREYIVYLSHRDTDERKTVTVSAGDALGAMNVAEILSGEEFVAWEAAPAVEKQPDCNTAELAIRHLESSMIRKEYMKEKWEYKYLIDEGLWQGYNLQLEGKFPVWDFSSDVTVLYLDFPSKEQFWMDEDGRDRYSIKMILVCRSVSDTEERYALKLTGIVSSYEEVESLQSMLRLGYHKMEICGWDERSNRFLEYDYENISGTWGFCALYIDDAYYV